MSLVVSWLTENFVAAASDGKAIVKDRDGNVVVGKDGEDCSKVHLVGDNALVAVVGDLEFMERLVEELRRLVTRGYDFPQLAEAVPNLCRALYYSLGVFPGQSCNVLLLGWDATSSRMRGVVWNSLEDFVPHEIPHLRIPVLGYAEENKQLAKTLALQCLPLCCNLEQVRAALEAVIKHVAQGSDRINANTKSYIIRRPE